MAQGAGSGKGGGERVVELEDKGQPAAPDGSGDGTLRPDEARPDEGAETTGMDGRLSKVIRSRTGQWYDKDTNTWGTWTEAHEYTYGEDDSE